MRAGGMDRQQALRRTLFVNDGRSRRTSRGRQLATQEDYSRRLTTTFQAVRPKVFGMMADKEGTARVTRELFGEDTGTPWPARGEGMDRRSRCHGRAFGAPAAFSIAWPIGVSTSRSIARFGGPKRAGEPWITRRSRARSKNISPKLDRTLRQREWQLLQRREFDAVRSLATIASGANKVEPGQAGGSSTTPSAARAPRFFSGLSRISRQYGGRDLWATMTNSVGRCRARFLMDHFGLTPIMNFLSKRYRAQPIGHRAQQSQGRSRGFGQRLPLPGRLYQRRKQYARCARLRGRPQCHGRGAPGQRAMVVDPRHCHARHDGHV